MSNIVDLTDGLSSAAAIDLTEDEIPALTVISNVASQASPLPTVDFEFNAEVLEPPPEEVGSPSSGGCIGKGSLYGGKSLASFPTKQMIGESNNECCERLRNHNPRRVVVDEEEEEEEIPAGKKSRILEPRLKFTGYRNLFMSMESIPAETRERFAQNDDYLKHYYRVFYHNKGVKKDFLEYPVWPYNPTAEEFYLTQLPTSESTDAVDFICDTESEDGSDLSFIVADDVVSVCSNYSGGSSIIDEYDELAMLYGAGYNR